jgi:hypothetical protein
MEVAQMQKRKQVSKKDFEKRIKMWTLLIPLITCFIGSFTTLGVTYLSNRSKIEYKIEENDQLEANKLSAQINHLCRKFFQTNNQDEKERFNVELSVLAEAEATVMRKYNPNYRPRWPILIEPLPIEGREVIEPLRSPFFLRPTFLIINLLFAVLASITAYIFLRQRYRREQIDVQVLEALQFHYPLAGANLEDIADSFDSETTKYSANEVRESLRRLKNKKQVEEYEGRWRLKNEA